MGRIYLYLLKVQNQYDGHPFASSHAESRCLHTDSQGFYKKHPSTSVFILVTQPKCRNILPDAEILHPIDLTSGNFSTLTSI